MRMEGELRDLGYALLLLVASFMQFGLTETIFGRNINISFFVVMTAAILAVAANRESRAEPTASSA
jgi:multisubunit Na+/H+ antiporter MnhG subunit